MFFPFLIDALSAIKFSLSSAFSASHKFKLYFYFCLKYFKVSFEISSLMCYLEVFNRSYSFLFISTIVHFPRYNQRGSCSLIKIVYIRLLVVKEGRKREKKEALTIELLFHSLFNFAYFQNGFEAEKKTYTHTYTLNHYYKDECMLQG